ncbi:hypothetical protein BT96DRAFT_824463, partial [Gymnopus androsaceus JB14]
MRLLLLCLLLLGLLCKTINVTSNIGNADYLLSRFRREYQKFSELVQEALVDAPDVFLLEMLGQELGEFRGLVSENEPIFEESELFTVRSGVEHMLHDIRILHDTMLQSSHNGRPEVVTKEYSGSRGRPKIVINRDFLVWAYRFRSTSGIAEFLGVSRTIVRQALLDYNIAVPGTNPFPSE